MTCTACGFANQPAAKFCGGCGKPLGSPSADRRQLTVLFCDLVDSTRLADELDPEDLREIVREYQAAAGEAINRFDGHVAQLLGDGLLVYFGYPRAHEDDVWRAVRTGLEIVQAVRGLNERLERHRGVRLAVRVGIHTGPVVAGALAAGGTQEQLAVGQTPNVAARLQALAGPDDVVLSGASHALVEGLFECEALGPQRLKGVSEPIEVYRALRESAARNRFEAAARRGLRPVVGRERELATLLECLHQSAGGRGQAALIRGEAGLGKSRLVHAMKEQAVAEGHVVVAGACSPHTQHSALFPVTTVLLDLLGTDTHASVETRLAKIEAGLSAYAMDLTEVVPLVAGLLSVPLPGRYSPSSLASHRQREKTLEIVIGILGKAAERQPLVVIFEDLHWVDPSTLELLDLLMTTVASSRILLLLTARPTFAVPWRADHLTAVDLTHLAVTDAPALVLGITGGKPLPREVMRQLVDKTDGVPLFIEEVTKMILASGLVREAADRYELAGHVPSLAIPTSLEASLTARLDQLSSGKDELQLGAVLGREFTFDVFRAVSGRDEQGLRTRLGTLVDAELLSEAGDPRNPTFVFKHALIQDAAYGSLLKRTRQQYHQQAATVLEERFPATAEARPELIAHHYTEAGLDEPAVSYWLKAGKRALERSANQEASAHFRKGLAVLANQPETGARNQQELDFQISLGGTLIASQGFTSPEVERAYARAEDLCGASEDSPDLFWVLVGLQRFHMVRGDLGEALRVSGRLLQIARSRRDDALLSAALHHDATSRFYVAAYDEAISEFEESLALASPDVSASYRNRTGWDARVVSLSIMALVLWLQGHPDRARESGRRAIALARELEHPHTLAHALNLAGAELHHFLREPETSQRMAEEAVAISVEQGFPLWAAMGTMFRGWAVMEASRPEPPADADAVFEGMFGSVMGIRGSGASLAAPYFNSLVAEFLWRRGQQERARLLVDEALAITGSKDIRDCFWEPELYRLRGELILADADGRRSDAEADFQRAIGLAQAQGAKSLELRAALSLARLWGDDGRPDRGRDLLTGVYEWFDEGLDTTDLREARAFLTPA